MNDIFMAKREDEVLTRITIEQYDKRYIVESPYSDASTLDSLLETVYAALLVAGYHPDTINQAFVEFAEEKGYKSNEEN